ncbi:MAG: carbohydrate ABC transporter permease [Fimbriimonadaceae bacterium]|nr:carbohydrate ABC transporter permease [Fimbriimonadaceae bacterium]QYK55583.1 MAG: carbohydrate ABC transporter permease [Fimbriimonadaceae bacterium]
MNAALAYAVSTLSFWGGSALALGGVFFAFQGLTAAPGQDRAASVRRLAWALALGALALLFSASLTPSKGLAVPVVWPVLPLPGWLAVAAGAVALGTFLSGLVEIRERRRSRWVQALVWAVAAVLCGAWAKAQGGPFELLTGRVSLSPVAALALGLLAVGAVAAMVATARSANVRQKLGRLAVTAVLWVGCFVFGVPFLWLLVTSFKEDRDMASPNGVVWVPRVQQTVPHLTPDQPYYAATYDGRPVEANLETKRADGTLVLSIARPVGLGGFTFEAKEGEVKLIPRELPMVTGNADGVDFKAMVTRELSDGRREVEFLEPQALKGQTRTFSPTEIEPYRPVSLRWRNYVEALEFLPAETQMGLVYLRNTLFLVVMNVIGTVASCSLVAYAFARLRFPGRETLFKVLLSTMMLPAAVTILPQFLIFKNLGWVNTLNPLWVPAFFTTPFTVFMLREFFLQIPYELEDAAKVDGSSYLCTFWSVMVPQIKPAIVVVVIWTFIGTWNNFMGPLIYVNTPELIPVAYAVQMFNGERNGEPGLLMAFVTMAMMPVLALFAFAQRYFIEGVSLSGLGGR